MNLDHLLIWMSARGHGSWTQFRGAVEELRAGQQNGEGEEDDADDLFAGDLPVYQAVRLSLQRLGHVEFFSSSDDADWRVVPPALALAERGEEWRGILCGARPPDLSNSLTAPQDSVTLTSETAPGMPACLRLTSPDLSPLRLTAADLALRVQVDSPRSLLAAVPFIRDFRARHQTEMPSGPGWTIEQFSTSALRWTTLDRNTGSELTVRDVVHHRNGFFRFRMKYHRFHFLIRQGVSFEVPVQIGKYAILAHRKVRGFMEYHPAREVFSVPVMCRPPLLVERALILCSGLLPVLDKSTGHLEYADVPLDVARLTAASVGQEIAPK